VKEAVNIQRDR